MDWFTSCGLIAARLGSLEKKKDPSLITALLGQIEVISHGSRYWGKIPGGCLLNVFMTPLDGILELLAGCPIESPGGFAPKDPKRTSRKS